MHFFLNSTSETVQIGDKYNTTLYSYNALNRLTKSVSSSGGETRYTYDNNGNLINKSSGTSIIATLNDAAQSGTDNSTTGDLPGFDLIIRKDTDNGTGTKNLIRYSYDNFNRLKTMKDEDTTASYTYNAQGYRVEKKINGTTTDYLYEGDKVVLETDKSNNQKAVQVYGNNLLSRSVDGSSGAGAEKYFYLYNAHGDVTSLINPTGGVAASYDYDAFGNIINKTGNADNSIMYAGYQHDDESGLYYLNARYYDSVTARFLTEDTVTGDRNDPLSLNLYTYCHNEPIMYDDPSGNKDKDKNGYKPVPTPTQPKTKTKAKTKTKVKTRTKAKTLVNNAPIPIPKPSTSKSKLTYQFNKGKLNSGTYGYAYEQDLKKLMNSDNPLEEVKYTALYFWDRWPGYWAKLMTHNASVSGLSPKWAEMYGDISSGFLLENYTVVMVKGVRAFKNIKTGAIIYERDIALGSGAGNLSKGVSKAENAWGILEDGTNQGVKHFSDYWEKYPERIPSIAKRLGVDPESFANTLKGFENFTNEALRVTKSEASQVRQVGDRTMYYINGAENANKGVVVIMKDGKLQSMMPSDPKSFLKLK